MHQHQTERREGYVEMPHEFVEKINTHIDTENGFIKGMYVLAGILSVAAAILGWVYLEDHAAIKENQKTIVEHTVQNARMLTLLENQVAVNMRQQDRIDKNTELLLSGRRQ
jgi:hypothetical protein